MLELRRGDRGVFVNLLQSRLLSQGYELVEDGVFGVELSRILRDFQSAWNLKADGVCGDETWMNLMQSRGLSRGGPYMRKRHSEILIDALGARGGGELGLLLCEEALRDVGKQEDPFGGNKGSAIVHLVQGTHVTGVDRLDFSEYKRHWGLGVAARFPLWSVIAISSWMASSLGVSAWSEIPFGNWFGSVSQVLSWGESVGILREDVGDCVAGELFVIPREGVSVRDGRVERVLGGHAGIILWDEGDRVFTIEGCTHNGVHTRHRRKEDLNYVLNWESMFLGN